MNSKWMLMVGILVLGACSKGPKAPDKVSAANETAPKVATVTAATAELRPLDRTVDVTGSLAPEDTTTMSSEVPGRIANIRYDFGQAVRKGDVVIELDKQELQLQVERTRAALTQSLARLGLDPNAADAPATTATLRQAEAQMEDARSKYDNAKKLVDTGDISRERYEELEKSLRARQAAVDVVRDDVRTQWANVQAIRTDLKLAEKRLGDATIRAPFDGVVSQRLVAPGQYVKDNVGLITLVKTYPLRLNVDIPEVAAAAVRVGTQLEFTTEAVPDKTFRAVVRELNPSLDSRSRSLSVQARIEGTNAALKPGMFVQVKLTLAKGQKVMMVPENAIITIAGLSKMFAVRQGKAVELHVTPGVHADGWVEVTDAELQPGETVATSALNELVNGASVNVSGKATALPTTKKGA
jgi:membrane fusion protein, multidrug efflux system